MHSLNFSQLLMKRVQIKKISIYIYTYLYIHTHTLIFPEVTSTKTHQNPATGTALSAKVSITDITSVHLLRKWHFIENLT